MERVTSTDHKEQYLPNFCQAQNLFLLVLITELLVIVIVLAESISAGRLWIELGITSLFVQWLVLLSAGMLCWLRRVLYRHNPMLVFGSAFVGVLVVSYLVSLVALWLQEQIHYAGPPGIGYQGDWFIIRNLVITAIITAGLFRYSYVQTLWKQKIQAELNARIQALQARIRPHFLFNSMNTIATLIATEPKLAEKIVEELSELFRASLADSDSLITLDDELSLCRRYLHIESLRLGKRLNVVWDILPRDKVFYLPPLMLQPLIENAIYHGVQPIPEGGEINISINVINNALWITIKNPVTDKPVAYKSTGHHLAIKNIQHRLLAIYGNAAKFEQLKTDNEYIVTIKIPEQPSKGIL